MPDYDINSPESANSYRARNKNLNNNPALAAFYFQMRWELFYEEVLAKKFKIKDYWWRYEWQHRGSSHIHGFLWIEDAPSVDKLDLSQEADKRTFINYWDQHISTIHPNRSSAPAAVHPSAQLFETLHDTKQELAEMLNRFQCHNRCTEGYCVRRRKAEDGTETKYCRFGFPFDVRPASEIIRPLGKDFQEFHTRRNDPELNPFNPTFILGWRANIDIRPVLNREAVIAYVAKYASKGETKSAAYQDMMKAAITNLDGSTCSAIAYQKMLSAFVGERDISGQEVSHIMFGCNLVRSSRRYWNLPVMMELTEEIDFENATLQNTALLKHYLERDLDTQDMRELTLWEFAQHCDWKGKTIRRRGQRNAKPYVVRVWPRYLPDPEDEEQYEKFCYAKMILHHPFSKTEGNTSWQEALKGGCSTWKAAYRELCLDNPSHSHPPDPLPNTIEVPRDIESSSGEDVEPEEEPLRFRPAWMQVAGERPNQQFSADISNLGRREEDNADWVLNSPGQEICLEASRWLSDQKKDSPNDDAQR